MGLHFNTRLFNMPLRVNTACETNSPNLLRRCLITALIPISCDSNSHTQKTAYIHRRGEEWRSRGAARFCVVAESCKNKGSLELLSPLIRFRYKVMPGSVLPILLGTLSASFLQHNLLSVLLFTFRRSCERSGFPRRGERLGNSSSDQCLSRQEWGLQELGKIGEERTNFYIQTYC